MTVLHAYVYIITHPTIVAMDLLTYAIKNCSTLKQTKNLHRIPFVSIVIFKMDGEKTATAAAAAVATPKYSKYVCSNMAICLCYAII